MLQPTFLPARLGLLALGLAVLLSGPPRAAASTAVVPDDYPTVQGGIDSDADTILVRAGTYAESPTMSAAPNRSRIVLLADPAASPRPTLQGLTVSILDHDTGDLHVVGLRVLDRVTVRTHSVIASYRFEACVLRGGLGHGGPPPAFDHAGDLALLRCVIRGASDLTMGRLTMESDTVEAGGMSGHAIDPVRVSNCWFRDSPIGLQLFIRTGGSSVEVVGNLFENCTTGLRVNDNENMAPVLVKNNRFRNCRDSGVRVEYAEEVDVFENSVWRCGVGIATYGTGPTRVIGNTVTEGTSHGIEILYGQYDLDIQDNAVLRCSGSGIRFEDYEWGRSYVRITANTSALNQRAGFDLKLYNAAQQPFTYDVSRNIGHGNGGPGFQWTLTGTGAPTLGCNDWFANTSGATSGVAPGATDIAVDPLFCDLANDDVRLRSESPVAGGPCGQIGALGVGCGATPTLVQRFTANRVSDGVRVVWAIAAGATASAVWVERAGSDVGGWTRPVTERSQDNRVVVELDGSAATDRTYWYRLVAQEGSAAEVIGAPIEVRAEARLEFRLAAVGPSPSSGPVRIGFALPRTADIQIAVFDVQGRRVATLASGAWPAGAHEVEWNGRTGGAPAPAGLYVLSYRYPGGTDKRAVIRVR